MFNIIRIVTIAAARIISFIFIFTLNINIIQIFFSLLRRDIKPHNLLVDPVRHVLKLCDFGSAKAFVKGEPNVAYICSRFYRAPELIFGSTEYTTAIDVWSFGCVFAELLSGSPLFPGSSGVDQLVEIIKVLKFQVSMKLLRFFSFSLINLKCIRRSVNRY